MNFLQLEYFLTILKFNSISKAASELYITQPALSQQLIHLEKELDTKLFYRKERQFADSYRSRGAISRQRTKHAV